VKGAILPVWGTHSDPSTMQLVVFDLDYTIWQPEMYQIDGPPKLISVDEFHGKQKRKSRAPPRSLPSGTTTIHQNKIATDRRNVPITVFDGASHALSEINRLKKDRPLQVAISSRTDEPGWAYQLMKWLVASDGTPLSKCFDENLIEISYQGKNNINNLICHHIFLILRVHLFRIHIVCT
jgi:hypothetical protein